MTRLVDPRPCPLGLPCKTYGEVGWGIVVFGGYPVSGALGPVPGFYSE